MNQVSTRHLLDLVFPFAVIAVVGMMIFPLPPFLLDALLTCNITFAVALIMSAVYLSEPERFTSLPSILLLSTLFRLGLNVSTTRQLLATGEAPSVVQAFGQFVAGGSLIVGVVVFVIVTLVQFMVIAKGAERVAEVAARFALDAMPGKQMSIDADVRAGMLGLEEAKEKRIDLQREAKLYGALDGAMKFVKGDSIAGLLITLINISAGLLVGMTEHGMSLATALQQYTIFTIGDGLVSQIPALLVAVAAGIAVTRVSDKSNSFVGRDIITQLSREPRAVVTTGVVLFGLALVPGLPSGLFLFGSILFCVIGVRSQSQQEKASSQEAEAEFRPKVYSALMFRVTPKATLILQQEGTLAKRVQEYRSAMFESMGVIVPDVQFDIDTKANDSAVVVYLHGVEIGRCETRKEPKKNGKVGSSKNEEFTIALVSFLDRAINERLSDLMTDTHTRILLEVHNPVAEDLINSVVPEYISVTGLTNVLRELVRDGIRIRELPTILQSITEHVTTAKQGSVAPEGNTLSAEIPGQGVGLQLSDVLTSVRIGLKRTISEIAVSDGNKLCCWMLDGSLDYHLGRIATSATPVAPGLAAKIGDVVKKCVAKHKETEPVIVASLRSRALLGQILRSQCIAVRVVAVEELVPELVMDVHGEVQVQTEIEGVVENVFEPVQNAA